MNPITENPCKLKEKPEFKAAVGMSRKWDAREAGQEVAQDTLNKLGKNVKPDFFLLFSTIHYEKHGGFKDFLAGIWDVLPEGTQMIGGTVAGFINQYGCYTRGASALGVSYPNMDIAIGIGNNTKRNPKKAARDCAQMIREKLEKSKYPNSYLFSLISGGLVFDIPKLGRRRVLPSISKKFTEKFIAFTGKVLNRGFGREDEVAEELGVLFNDFSLIGGASMDNAQFLSDYQFFGRDIYTSSVVSLALKTDINIELSRTPIMHVTNKHFRITKFGNDRRIVHEINNKPAVKEFLRVINWPNTYMDERLHRRTLFYPFGFNFNDEIRADVLALVLGDSMIFVHEIKSEDISILSISGKDLLSASHNSLKYINPKPLVSLIVSCEARIEGLGSNIYMTWSDLKNFFKDTPFLGIYASGEYIKKPQDKLKYGNETFNVSSFSIKD